MGSPLPIREGSDGVVVDVWVVPGASGERVGGLHDGALRVRVGAPPEGGAANKAVGKAVAAAIGGRRGRVVSGGTARRKQVHVAGVSFADATRRLAELLGGS
jgi:uncharacterized protein (TIGR00251 family)